MKKLIYLLLILFAGIANSQNILFDGTVFKNKLLASNASNGAAKNQSGASIVVDDNNDGEISLLEALDVYKIDLSNLNEIGNLLGIKSFYNLESLDCKGCGILSLDLSGLNHLETLDVKNNNNLTALNVTGCTAMLSIDCKNDDIRSLDLSTLNNLQQIDVKNNNDLASIYAKNGVDEDIIMDSSCTLLKYICVDDFDTNSGQLSDCVINSFCTSSPGGDFNTLKGKLFFVENAGAQPGMKLKCVFSANSSIQYAVTDALGNYVFYTTLTWGNATITPVLDAPNAGTLFASLDAITQTQPISGTNNIYTINDIVLAIGTQQKHDYEVVVMPITAALPGQQAVYDIVYRNKGCKKIDSDIEFRFPTTLATFVSSSVTPSVIPTSATGYYKVPFVNLLPFESRKFRVTLNILPTATLGAVLNFDANVILSTNFTVIDPYLADNTFTLKQLVGVAYGNNRITCLQGNTIAASEIGNYLHYEVYFTNTGTQTATDVIIKTDFSPLKYNLNSMQMLKSSHNMEMEIANGFIIIKNPFFIARKKNNYERQY